MCILNRTSCLFSTVSKRPLIFCPDTKNKYAYSTQQNQSKTTWIYENQAQ